MADEPRNYGAHTATGGGPSIELQQRAFEAVKTHPHFLDACSFKYCEPMVMIQPRSFLDRMKIPADILQQMSNLLGSKNSVVLLSYFTSQTMPEPMSGHGDQYIFLLHPDTLAILHTTVGKWRS